MKEASHKGYTLYNECVLMVARGQGEWGIRQTCLIGKGFYFGAMKIFWNRIEVLEVEHCECIILNGTELFTSK